MHKLAPYQSIDLRKAKRVAGALLAVLVAASVAIAMLEIRAARLSERLFAAIWASDTALAVKALDDGADPASRYNPKANGPIWMTLRQRLLDGTMGGKEAESSKDRTWEPALISCLNYTPDGRPPVDNTAILLALLNHGANPNITFHGETAFDLARNDGFSDAAHVLIEHGANVNARDFHRFTPLQEAADSKQLAIAEDLLKHGADVNAVQEDGFSALYLAVDEDQPQIVTLLLRYGADPNIAAANGTSPLHLARSKKEYEMIKLLTKVGAR